MSTARVVHLNGTPHTSAPASDPFSKVLHVMAILTLSLGGTEGKSLPSE
jgi:hypothetical protein